MLLHDLHELQAKHGWLSDETLRTFARERNVPLYELEAVTTFYPHFRRSPPPRASVTVCRDASCHLRGGVQYLGEIRHGLMDQCSPRPCRARGTTPHQRSRPPTTDGGTVSRQDSTVPSA